ncbi:MAG: NAD(+)/NADH kinase [Candidatus Latescibacterota bacterium]
MKLQLNKIGVLPRDEDLDYPVDEVRALFEKYGIDVCFIESEEDPDGLDLVVALGGDGTVLRAFDRFSQCPVIAINFGTVGFLTAGDRKDLAQIVQLLVDGRYIVSERLVLACRFPGGEGVVYNEVTLRARHKLLFTDVFVDDVKIRTIRGDGVVGGHAYGQLPGLLMAMGRAVGYARGPLYDSRRHQRVQLYISVPVAAGREAGAVARQPRDAG